VAAAPPPHPAASPSDGRTFKSAVVNGRAVPEGLEREHPWVAIKPVADAIATMEDLHHSSLIFPASLFRRTNRPP
jgi:hypothetical protein